MVLGVLTTSQILMGVSRKLSFSTLTKVGFGIDKPLQCASSDKLACSAKVSRQAMKNICVEGYGPIFHLKS